jgi:hypothetical protein
VSEAAVSQSAGRWEERGTAADYFLSGSVHCDCCGRMLVREAWVAAVNGGECVFCDPACERLYRTYWLPRHGRRDR